MDQVAQMHPFPIPEPHSQPSLHVFQLWWPLAMLPTFVVHPQLESFFFVHPFEAHKSPGVTFPILPLLQDVDLLPTSLTPPSHMHPFSPLHSGLNSFQSI